MLFLSLPIPISKAAQPARRTRTFSSLRGFTLVELSMAMSVITVFLLGSIFAMTHVNRYANISRLQTMALAAAQQRIDEILITPWNVSDPRPTTLANGTPQPAETNIPLNNDVLNNAAGLSSLYTSLDSQINATRTTTVSTIAWATSGTTTIRADVTVSYTYRNRPYSVTLSTLRTTDTI